MEQQGVAVHLELLQTEQQTAVGPVLQRPAGGAGGAGVGVGASVVGAAACACVVVMCF